MTDKKKTPERDMEELPENQDMISDTDIVEEEARTDKMSRFKALIDSKKNGSHVPLPRKGKGINSLDENTTLGTKAVRKTQKSGSHNSK